MIDIETYFKNADKVLRGLNQLGVSLGLTHVTKAIYEPLLLDAKAKAEAFAQARQGKSAAHVALRSARAEAVAYLMDVRNYLTGFLGAAWSPLWAPLGFNNSLKLPATDAGRCQMLAKVKAYFTSHPEHENAAEDYTAARADALCAPISNAVIHVDHCKFDTRSKRDARGAALKLLDKKISALRNELTSVLDPLDPRWLKFFDRIPGDPRVPEAVEDLTATAEPGGIINLDWPDAARAARYRVLKQVVGTDPEWVPADTVEESAAQLTGVPSGATVKLQVVPVNGVGEGPASEVIELQAA
jgi:hypothetical protein